MDLLIRKNFNIFQSIQYLYDTGCYLSMDDIFSELTELLPDKINISTEGITDDFILSLLNHINGCSLEADYYYSVSFIKNNETLFKWNLKNDYFWVTYNIWKVFEEKYRMNSQEMSIYIKNSIELYCKIGAYPHVES